MGGSESKSTVENIIKNNTYNEDDISTINKSISKDISKNIEKTNNTCETQVLVSQIFDMSSCKIGGDFNLSNVNQSIDLNIKSDCSNEVQKKSSSAKSYAIRIKKFYRFSKKI